MTAVSCAPFIILAETDRQTDSLIKPMQSPFHHKCIFILIFILQGTLILCVVDIGSFVTFSLTIHELLCNSWQLMEMNGGRGLLQFTEECLEALHKRIRHLREG